MARTLVGNFKGPKGDRGDQGATGPVGPEGKQGPVGPAGGVNSVNGVQGDVVIGGTQILRGTDTANEIASSGKWEDGTYRPSRTPGLGDPKKVSVSDAPDPNIRYGWDLSFEGNSEGYKGIAQDNVPVAADTPYTMSCYVKGEGALQFQYVGTTGKVAPAIQVSSERWERRSWTFSVTPDLMPGNGTVGIFFMTRARAQGDSSSISICGMKLELGTVATDWSPAPADQASAADLSALIARVAALEAKMGISSSPVGEMPEMDVPGMDMPEMDAHSDVMEE